MDWLDLVKQVAFCAENSRGFGVVLFDLVADVIYKWLDRLDLVKEHNTGKDDANESQRNSNCEEALNSTNEWATTRSCLLLFQRAACGTHKLIIDGIKTGARF